MANNYDPTPAYVAHVLREVFGKAFYVRPQVDIARDHRRVIFDLSVNVEKSDLKYVRQDDKNIEVEVQLIQPNGKISKETFGKMGGKKIIKTLSAQDDDKSLKEAAKNEFSLWSYDGFEGDFTCWLIPYVEPGDIVELRDITPLYESDPKADQQRVRERGGNYFVSGTHTTFSASSGGSRKVTISRRIS